MSLKTFDLPMIFASGLELAQATANFRREDYPTILPELVGDFSDEDESETKTAVDVILRWHRELNAIVHASARLKRALGATGPLDVADQLRNKGMPMWEEFFNRFKYAAHPAKIRKALCKLTDSAADLSGYATLPNPDAELRQRGLRLLQQGLADLWSGLSSDEREKARPLLTQTSVAIGWHPDLEGQAPVDQPDDDSVSCFRVVDFSGGFATRPADFFEKKAAALAQAFPAMPVSSLPPLFPVGPTLQEVNTPMERFPLALIFQQALKYAVVIWDKKSQVKTDRDPFDCVPDFSEIGVARCHFAQAMGIPSYTKQGWRDAVKKEAISELARQGLIHLNEAEEWEHLPRDRNGNRQPGSLRTAFGLFEQGLKEIYSGMSPEDREMVKDYLPLIRERWDINFPGNEMAEGRKDRRKTPIPKEEANILIRRCLKNDPEATIKKIRDVTQVSAGAISQSSAWQAHQAAKSIREDQPNRPLKALPLTKKMLEFLGQSDDPSAAMSEEEAAWRHLLENATEKERADLHKLSPRERAARIQALLEQVGDRIDCERKPYVP